jgi:hypothetical protein
MPGPPRRPPRRAARRARSPRRNHLARPTRQSPLDALAYVEAVRRKASS